MATTIGTAPDAPLTRRSASLAIPSLLSALAAVLHVRKRPRASASPEGALPGEIFGAGIGTKVLLGPVPSSPEWARSRQSARVIAWASGGSPGAELRRPLFLSSPGANTPVPRDEPAIRGEA